MGRGVAERDEYSKPVSEPGHSKLGAAERMGAGNPPWGADLKLTYAERVAPRLIGKVARLHTLVAGAVQLESLDEADLDHALPAGLVLRQ